MGQSLLLAVLVATNQIELWHVYILAAVLGLANAFEQPTRQRRSSSRWWGKGRHPERGGLEFGPVQRRKAGSARLSAASSSRRRVEAPFFINFVSFYPDDRRPSDDGHESAAQAGYEVRAGNGAISELREGISHRPADAGDAADGHPCPFIGMFGFNFIVVLPLVAKYVLDGGSEQLGIPDRSAWGRRGNVGAGAGRPERQSRTSRCSWAVRCSLCCWGRSPRATGSRRPSRLGTARRSPDGVRGDGQHSVQLATPDHLRGRVMGLWMLLFRGSTPFGGDLTGFLAEHIGVEEAIGFNAGMCAIGVAVALVYYASHHRDIVTHGGREPVDAGGGCRVTSRWAATATTGEGWFAWFE